MSATLEISVQNLSLTQATELSLLVDLEARWENLRTPRSQTPEMQSTAAQDLHSKQKAYEAFRARLAAFNKKYQPAHVPELLLNNPVRLGLWCKKMRDLYVQVEQDPRVPCPVHLLEKAYRCADRMAGRLGKDLFSRCKPLDSTQTAIRELEALLQWCGGVTRLAS
jgi:hypothetical protein